MAPLPFSGATLVGVVAALPSARATRVGDVAALVGERETLFGERDDLPAELWEPQSTDPKRVDRPAGDRTEPLL